MRYFYGIMLMLITSLAAAGEVTSENDISTFTNPTDVALADPCVIRHGETYYLYGTSDSTNARGFEVYTSPDLVRWTLAGTCFEPGSETWGSTNFWAPEVTALGDKFYLHYTAYSRNEKRRNICVAVADSPLGPFKDYAGPLFDDMSVIDSHLYRDPRSGKTIIYCVPERYEPAGILAAEISSDLKKVLTTPTLCLKADYGWEDMWAEGPVILEHEGTLYMIYSGSAYWESEYALGYATATNPLGPWTKSPANPILKRNAHVHGPGHNGLAVSPDGKELFCVYHVHAADWTSRRVIALDRIAFENNPAGGPDLLTMPGAPKWQPQPLPSGAKPFPAAQSDEFDSPQATATRWHVYASNPRHFKVADGALQITAADGDFWKSHDNGENLFLQPVPPGDFAAETSISMNMNRVNQQAGLVIWEDRDNYVMFTAIHQAENRFSVTREHRGKPDTHLEPNPTSRPGAMRLERRGDSIRLLAGKDGTSLKPIGPDVRLEGIVPRYVGLCVMSPGDDTGRTAHIDYFRIQSVDPDTRPHKDQK